MRNTHMRRPTSKAMYIYKDVLGICLRKSHHFFFDASGFGDQLFAEDSGESRDHIRCVIFSSLREDSIFIGVDIWSDQHLVSGRRNHISIERVPS